MKCCSQPLARFLLMAAAVAVLLWWVLNPSDRSRLSAGLQAAGAAVGARSELRPRPAYPPDKVVRIQIEALGDNDRPHPDAGIEITFRFASPANRKVTGPLPRFIEMVHNPAYRPMLNHRGARYGKLKREEDHASQTVILKTGDGSRVGYLFQLSRQSEAPYKDCWMTDSVMRFEVRDDYRQV
ncbi:MAG: DUF4864 domain-containing protein [Acidobacteria bacterium]|nr:DUF4864 domain-containing protein [Acidobacteriota bacterium]